MEYTEEKLMNQLLESGEKLLPPSDSVNELLQKLDHIEALLVEVEQSPPKSMLEAIIPSMKALIVDELVRHSDIDVKVAVACCISEITRITAPEAPYDDEKMKDVFELIVSSFEDLSDKTSRSYTKRISILETVAKVRSCVIMLDLECECLIVDMFRHFLRSIRDYHPEKVFSAMVAIMVLVLEESEEISLELLSPILEILKKDNQELLILARKLVERVFESCAAKIKPCLVQAVESDAISLNEYNNVVASVCGLTCVKENGGPTSEELPAEEKTLVEPSPHDVPQPAENKLDESTANDMPQVSEETVSDEHRNDHPVSNKSPQAEKISGSTIDPSAEHESSNKPEIIKHTDEMLDTNENTAVVSQTSDSSKEVQAESHPEQSMKKITNISDDGQHTDKKSDTSATINAESGDGQHSDQIDDNMVSKAGSSDLGSTKGVKLKLKSEETTQKGSKKIEDAQETVQSVETNDIESGDLESSKMVKSKSKSEQIGKKRSKKADEVNEVGKAESGDLDTVVKLKLKSEEAAKESPKTQEDAFNVSKDESGEIDKTKVVTETKAEQSSKSSKKPDEGQDNDQPINTNEAAHAESVELNSPKVIKPELKSGQTTGRKRRRKVNCFSTREPSGPSFVDDHEKDAGKLSDQVDHTEEVPSAPSEDLMSKKAKLSGDASTQSGTLTNENQQKKSAQVNKKQKQGTGSFADVDKDLAEGPSDPDLKNKKQSGKKVAVKDATESKTTPVTGGKGKKMDKKDTSMNIDISSLKRKSGGKISQRKGNADKNTTSKASSKVDKKDLQISSNSSKKLDDDQSVDPVVETSKTKSKGKNISGKEKEPQLPTKPSSTLPEDMDVSEETPKTSNKRKRSGKENSGAIKYDGSLVGSKVKVWWPDDAQFYLGVIESFDPVKKKHKVLYDDGDEETLFLKKERWEIIEDESKTLKENDDDQSDDELSEMFQRKKLKTAEKTPKQGKADSTRGGKKLASKSKPSAKKSSEEEEEEENDTEEGNKTTDSKSTTKSDESESDAPTEKNAKKPIKSKTKGSSSKPINKRKTKGKTNASSDEEEEEEEEEIAKESSEIEPKTGSNKKGKTTGGGTGSKRTKKRKRN